MKSFKTFSPSRSFEKPEHQLEIFYLQMYKLPWSVHVYILIYQNKNQ